eukprot:m.268977 g.268977  ORF g.268977 m.268977 type:complete len:929 (+) comp54734_c0_seq2:265-3051(+)
MEKSKSAHGLGSDRGASGLSVLPAIARAQAHHPSDDTQSALVRQRSLPSWFNVQLPAGNPVPSIPDRPSRRSLPADEGPAPRRSSQLIALSPLSQEDFQTRKRIGIVSLSDDSLLPRVTRIPDRSSNQTSKHTNLFADGDPRAAALPSSNARKDSVSGVIRPSADASFLDALLIHSKDGPAELRQKKLAAMSEKLSKRARSLESLHAVGSLPSLLTMPLKDTVSIAEEDLLQNKREPRFRDASAGVSAQGTRSISVNLPQHSLQGFTSDQEGRIRSRSRSLPQLPHYTAAQHSELSKFLDATDADLFEDPGLMQLLRRVLNRSDSPDQSDPGYIQFASAASLHSQGFREHGHPLKGRRESVNDPKMAREKCDKCICIRTGGGYLLFGNRDEHGRCVSCGQPLDGNLEDLRNFLLGHHFESKPPSDPDPAPVRPKYVPPPAFQLKARAQPPPPPPQPVKLPPVPSAKSVPPPPAPQSVAPPAPKPSAISPPKKASPSPVRKAPLAPIKEEQLPKEKPKPVKQPKAAAKVLSNEDPKPVPTPKEVPRDPTPPRETSPSPPPSPPPRLPTPPSVAEPIEVFVPREQTPPTPPTPPASPPPTPPRPETPKPQTPPPVIAAVEAVAEAAPTKKKKKLVKKKVAPPPVPEPEPVIETPPSPPAVETAPPEPEPEPVPVEPEPVVEVRPPPPVAVPPSRKPFRKAIPKTTPVVEPPASHHSPTHVVFEFLPEAEIHELILNWLLQFCILTPAKRQQYTKAFKFFDSNNDAFLTPDEVARALQGINSNLMSPQQSQYVMGILSMILECQPHNPLSVDLNLFCVIAALSERVVALDPIVADCLNKTDFQALQKKLKKARDMFVALNPSRSGAIPLDVLRIELKAGRISEEHEEEAVGYLIQQGLQDLSFLDFMVYLPLFLDIHSDILSFPLSMDRKR